MFNNGRAILVEGTEFEYDNNSRLFDVTVSKRRDYGSAIFHVLANSFNQAVHMAIDKANALRDLYLSQMEHPSEANLFMEGVYKEPFVPADVRKMEVIREAVYHRPAQTVSQKSLTAA